MQPTRDQLKSAQKQIMEKVEMYKKTKNIDYIRDIQGVVNKIGMEFVLEAGEKKMHFIPEKLKLGNGMDEAIRNENAKKTKSGIVLPK